MRVAIFTDLYLDVPGGIPSSIEAQKQALTRMGHHVKVFCPGLECDDRDVELLPTSWLKIEGAPMGKSPEKMMRFMEEKYPDFGKKFDLVHVHYEAEVSILGVWMARKYDLPLVQTMHGREDMAIATNVPHGFRTFIAGVLNVIHGHYLKGLSGDEMVTKRDEYLAPTVARAKMWELMARQANAADIVLAPSGHFAEKLKEYGVDRRLRVLSNGVPEDILEGVDWKVRKLDENYAADGEKLRIVWSARASREKRLVPFLQALAIVREHTDKFMLTVVSTGNELNEARAFVKKNNLSNNVAFLGGMDREEAILELENQHLSVTNSYGFDTQGLTILEATATGLPVLYCDPDMDTVVLSGTGVRAKDETPEEMAKLILKIMRRPEVIEMMSRKAFASREEVMQEAQILKLEKIYFSLLRTASVSSASQRRRAEMSV